MKQPGYRSCFAPVAPRNRQGDSRGSAASSPDTNLLKTARPVGGCTLCRGPESGSYRRLCPRIDFNAMLENINLKKRLSREEYKLALPGLQQRLYDLEKACWEYGVPSVIVFEGWDSAGKGTAIAALTQRLDPRGFKM